MLHNQGTSSEIVRRLQALTNASQWQSHGDTPAMRLLGEQAYNEIYAWLEDHQVQFMYDSEQGCYVEVLDENDYHS